MCPDPQILLKFGRNLGFLGQAITGVCSAVNKFMLHRVMCKATITLATKGPQILPPRRYLQGTPAICP